jgi:phosphate transport system substrate-binding protein
VAACTGSRSTTRTSEPQVILAGSTSVLPFAERWAESYRDGKVTVQAGGSTAGIRAARDGTADIGMSSRALRGAEAAGLVGTPVALDGIAIIVHASNRVRALSLRQLREIYAGRVTNWRAVGGEPGPITVITREEGSGTRDMFEQLVMQERSTISVRALVTAYSGGLRKMVAEDPRAIGYVTFSQVTGQARALVIDGVAPSERNIASGRYVLQRPFLFITQGAPRGAAAAFLRFVLSEEGQDIARAEGLASVNAVVEEPR